MRARGGPRAPILRLGVPWGLPRALQARTRDAGGALQAELADCAVRLRAAQRVLRLKVSRWLDSFQIKFVGRGGEGEFFDLLDPQRELPELGGHCALFQPHRSSFKKMDIYDTSIMDPDPPRPDERPDESSTVRPEDAAPPPPANSEDVSPTLAGLKTVGGAVGGAALAGLGAVKNVAAGLAATVLDDLLEPEENQGALDDVLRRMSDDGDGSPPGGLLAHTRNEERRRREAEYKAAQERHARAARELAEAEKRRQQPDEVNFSA